MFLQRFSKILFAKLFKNIFFQILFLGSMVEIILDVWNDDSMMTLLAELFTLLSLIIPLSENSVSQ